MRGSVRLSSSDKKEVDFKPIKLVCLTCKSVISSRFSGHLCSCDCGKIAIDQTESYVRILGSKEDFTEVLNEEN